jgi:hypothetical protein
VGTEPSLPLRGPSASEGPTETCLGHVSKTLISIFLSRQRVSREWPGWPGAPQLCLLQQTDLSWCRLAPNWVFKGEQDCPGGAGHCGLIPRGQSQQELPHLPLFASVGFQKLPTPPLLQPLQNKFSQVGPPLFHTLGWIFPQNLQTHLSL